MMLSHPDYTLCTFGNILADSNPGLFMPLAFAGGLRDRFTGLVRFCHRDYDPTVGRFTAPDPLGDTGGDHDLYDYCVDEPVGRVDPEGLWGIALESSASAGAGVYPLTDTKSKGASIGSFLEYVPESDSGKDAHGVNAGMYKTQSEGDIAGAKAGFGYSLTLLKRPAEEVLQGDSRYSTHTLGPLSFTTYANPETGEEQAWGIGFGGKGTGLAVEGGTSTGVIAGKDVKP
jgi:RHS repeat-associated protein